MVRGYEVISLHPSLLVGKSYSAPNALKCRVANFLALRGPEVVEFLPILRLLFGYRAIVYALELVLRAQLRHLSLIAPP